MKKLIFSLIIVFALAKAVEEQPSKKQRTEKISGQPALQIMLQSMDGVQIPLREDAIALAPCIADVLKQHPTYQLEEATTRIVPFAASAETLTYFSRILNQFALVLDHQNRMAFAENPQKRMLLLQRKDGKFIAKNALPLVKNALANISEDAFKSLLYIADACSIDFLLNALSKIFIEKYYPGTSSTKYLNFLKDAEKLIAEYGKRIFSYMRKHAYFQTDELSIGDLLALDPDQLKPQAIINGPETLNRITIGDKQKVNSLEGIELLNWKNIDYFLINAPHILLNYKLDPNFPSKPFRKAKDLKIIQIYKNRYPITLPETFLSGADRLEEFTLNENTNTLSLPQHFFDPVSHSIRHIELAFNDKLDKLPEDIFLAPSMHNLKSIDLSDTPLYESSFSFQLSPNFDPTNSKLNKADNPESEEE